MVQVCVCMYFTTIYLPIKSTPWDGTKILVDPYSYASHVFWDWIQFVFHPLPPGLPDQPTAPKRARLASEPLLTPRRRRPSIRASRWPSAAWERRLEGASFRSVAEGGGGGATQHAVGSENALKMPQPGWGECGPKCPKRCWLVHDLVGDGLVIGGWFGERVWDQRSWLFLFGGE